MGFRVTVEGSFAGRDGRDVGRARWQMGHAAARWAMGSLPRSQRCSPEILTSDAATLKPKP